jgi:ketosteroid isomerase-like protein
MGKDASVSTLVGPTPAESNGASSMPQGDGRLSARRLREERAVADLFEAFSRRDLANALSLVHPEIVFRPLTAAVTRAGEPYRGHDGIRRYMADVEAHWEQLTVCPAQIRAAGRAVVALGVVSGRGPAGSFEDAPTTWVVKFREGLVVHAQIFSDERNAVNALVGGGREGAPTDGGVAGHENALVGAGPEAALVVGGA